MTTSGNNSDSDDETQGIYKIFPGDNDIESVSLVNQKSPSIMTTMKVNDNDVDLEVDTSAVMTSMCEVNFGQLKDMPKLRPTTAM